MQRLLVHGDWQRLRHLLRAGTPLSGKKLRLVPDHRTKSGKFLDHLVSEGLIEVVSIVPVAADALPNEQRLPVQFRTLYRLTAKGLTAADYGEYEVADPRPLPVYDDKKPPTSKKPGRPRRKA
jgi:hypothetical protein